MKVYQITESELLALLNSFLRWRDKYLNSPEDISNPLGRDDVIKKWMSEAPDLSNLKEVEQVVDGIDWKGLEKEAKEYFPAAAKEYATKQGGHDKPHITAWDFVSGVDSVLSWLKTNLPKYYTAPVKEQVESRAEYEPAIMQSAFHFENGIRMICYSSYEQGIKSFECNEDWQPFTKPFAACPFDWSGHKTMTEYHLKIRSLHKPELFVPEQSTKL